MVCVYLKDASSQLTKIDVQRNSVDGKLEVTGYFRYKKGSKGGQPAAHAAVGSKQDTDAPSTYGNKVVKLNNDHFTAIQNIINNSTGEKKEKIQSLLDKLSSLGYGNESGVEKSVNENGDSFKKVDSFFEKKVKKEE